VADSFSTLVFDLDGTLSDPSSGIANCINYALKTHGFIEVANNRIAREIGPPLDAMFRRFRSEVSTEVMDSLIARYRERYQETGYAENEVYPNIAESLARLADSGVRLGICTSKRSDFAEKILDLFGIQPPFAFVSGGDIGVSKDSQLASLLTDNSIDENAVMIGDRSVDIMAANANGLRSIGVLWGFGSLAEIVAANPTHTVSDVTEMMRIVI
jgi:phosphoglycolate phosphatase